MADVTLISRGLDGSVADGDSFNSNISGDGKFIVFDSTANDLVPLDGNPLGDVFLFDVEEKTIELISISSSNVPASGNSSREAEVSNGGNYVVFESSASDLVTSNTGNYNHVYLRDVAAGTTRILTDFSLDQYKIFGGKQASISADGKYVTFTATQTHNVTYKSEAVFRFNTQDKTIKIISPIDEKYGGNSSDSTVSGDGRYVAYVSDSDAVHSAAGLDITNSVRNQIFLYDAVTGLTEVVSSAPGFNRTNGTPIYPRLSTDGSTLTYLYLGSYTGDEGYISGHHIVAYDIATGTKERIKTTEALTLSRGEGSYDISGDGRYIAFYSKGSVPQSASVNEGVSVYVYDRLTEKYARVTETPIDPYSTGTSVNDIFISDDGKTIGYATEINSLIAGDDNNSTDVFTAANPLFGAVPDNNTAIKDLFSAQSETVQALSAAYAFLLGGVPNEAGYTFLINGAVSTNFGAGAGVTFNQENKFINLVNNLVQDNVNANAQFNSIASGTTLQEKITAIYKAVVPLSKQTDEGLAFITRADGLKFYQDVAAERGVAGTDGAAIVALASLLKIAVTGDYGIGNSVNDLLKAVAAGSSAIPISGSTLTPIETADGDAFDTDDASVSRLATASRNESYIQPDETPPAEETSLVGLLEAEHSTDGFSL